MRTTLTLEPEVAASLEWLAAKRQQPLNTLVNEVLQVGLAVIDRPPPPTAVRTAGFDLGPSLVGSLDNVEEVLARVEGEPHR